MRKSVLALSVTLALIANTSIAYATLKSDSSSHSVDSGEIRWGTYHGSTQYTSARDNAISEWDALGHINIAGDTVFTIEDLSFDDYNMADGYLGWWHKNTGADEIEFNEVYFNVMSDGERNKTALHEMGHALNLAHTTNQFSVMREGQISQSVLYQYDINDYNARWGD